MDVLNLPVDEALRLAIDHDTGADVLAALLRHEDERVQDAAAYNFWTPHEALIEVAKTASVNVKATIVDNKSVPVKAAAKIAFASGDSKVLQWFSFRRDLTPKMMIKLASNENVMVVSGMARNPRMPVEAGLVATLGRSEKDLKSIFAHHRFNYPSFASWLTNKDVDFSGYTKASSLPFRFFLDWLGECDDVKARYECVELVLRERFAGVRAHVELLTGVTGLPDAWVGKTFKTVAGAV